MKKNKLKMKNIITEIKNTLETMNSRVGDTEKCISDLKDRIMETAPPEQQKENQIKK